MQNKKPTKKDVVNLLKDAWKEPLRSRSDLSSHFGLVWLPESSGAWGGGGVPQGAREQGGGPTDVGQADQAVFPLPCRSSQISSSISWSVALGLVMPWPGLTPFFNIPSSSTPMRS